MNQRQSGQLRANPGSFDAGDHVIVAALAGDPLGRLLAVAAAPGSPRELLGEDAAVAAFRSASALPAPSIIRDQRSRRVTIALAVQAAGALVVALGGVALAAGTGLLPNPLVDVSESLPAPLTATPISTVSATGPSHATSDPPPVDQPVSASVAGLCRAYQTHGGDGPAMGSEAFGALVAAAGGADRVGEFCAGILADPPGSSNDEHSNDEHGPPTEPPGHSAGPSAPVSSR